MNKLTTILKELKNLNNQGAASYKNIKMQKYNGNAIFNIMSGTK
jgi:hypothetical protein